MRVKYACATRVSTCKVVGLSDGRHWCRLCHFNLHLASATLSEIKHILHPQLPLLYQDKEDAYLCMLVTSSVLLVVATGKDCKFASMWLVPLQRKDMTRGFPTFGATPHQ